jgi:iron complex outermembrane receptor protein
MLFLVPKARALCAATLCCVSFGAQAQVASPAAPASSPEPVQRVEVTGGRLAETEQRRQSTASKIVIGRDEIERFGDSSTAELLKRLPGISVQGAPGRGGAVRMRGLGAGYTQILVDGERTPPGFSIDSLAPEQIERIEILRAPTAETGARAIAGTLNIVLREGARQRRGDARLATRWEDGHVSPSASWAHNDNLETLNYSFSLQASRQPDETAQRSEAVTTALASGEPVLIDRSSSLALATRQALHANGRLQWRGNEGESLTLSPTLLHSQTDTERSARLRRALDDPAVPNPPNEQLYDHLAADAVNRFTLARLGAQWNHRVDGTRLEWRGGMGEGRWRSHTLRRDFDAADDLLRTLDDSAQQRDRSGNAGLKLSRLLENDHSLVGGAEAERVQRVETRVNLQDGTPIATDFGDQIDVASGRSAVYVQDEWSVTPHWSAHAGLRWERIVTEGDGADGARVRNRSEVASPLLHAVWKPQPQGRDQVRMSLTRSYRAPTLQNLVARPSINTRFPADGGNTPAQPDRTGSPALRPELATGLDLAFERYLSGGGLLSIGVFQRRISDLIRNVVTLESVSWSDQPRYVSRPQNIGDATSRGLELEAKLRLSDVWADAPRIDVRGNANLYRSKVEGVAGPDNRLDQQPGATASVAADYRWPELPLTLGGSLAWTPGYDTRLSDVQTAYVGRKQVIDAYALWVFNPALQLRITASNLSADDYVTAGSIDDDDLRESSRTVQRSAMSWQLRLEIKL